MKNFSQACENNKGPIFEQLQRYFSDVNSVFEIGSGTGQHAVYFGEQFPNVLWQTSDLPHNHASINAWRDDSCLENVLAPISFDIDQPSWPVLADAVFTANTLHIVSWQQVVSLFAGLAKHLQVGGLFCVYGPFNFGGSYTSESNRAFDQSLQQRDPLSGIRDFEKVNALAEEASLLLLDDVAMPANNHFLVFRKV